MRWEMKWSRSGYFLFHCVETSFWLFDTEFGIMGQCYSLDVFATEFITIGNKQMNAGKHWTKLRLIYYPFSYLMLSRKKRWVKITSEFVIASFERDTIIYEQLVEIS